MQDNFIKNPKMPVMFIGHGSPMNALDSNKYYEYLEQISREIPKPKYILVISAHYIDRQTSLTSMQNPETIYDFGGFPNSLYEIKYKAKGAPELANKIKDYLKDIEDVKLEDKYWGFDHGVWVPLIKMYPEEDIPVVVMSLNLNKLNGKSDAEYCFKIGESLKRLRQEGVLIISSGNIVHNLKLADFSKINQGPFAYQASIDFQNSINQAILKRDFETVFDYQNISGSQIAIDTPDHLFPLFYILGLSDKEEKVEIFNDEILAGSLSMTSYIFGKS